MKKGKKKIGTIEKPYLYAVGKKIMAICEEKGLRAYTHAHIEKVLQNGTVTEKNKHLFIIHKELENNYTLRF